jgi:hypothetical protein
MSDQNAEPSTLQFTVAFLGITLWVALVFYLSHSA